MNFNIGKLSGVLCLLPSSFNVKVVPIHRFCLAKDTTPVIEHLETKKIEHDMSNELSS